MDVDQTAEEKAAIHAKNVEEFKPKAKSKGTR